MLEYGSVENLEIEYSEDPCGEDYFRFDYYPEYFPLLGRLCKIEYTKYYRDRFDILIKELIILDQNLDINLFEVVPPSEYERGHIRLSGACKNTSVYILVYYLKRACDWVFRDYCFWTSR